MRKKAVLLTICSAVLLALALPNDLLLYGNPLVGLICLAPYFAALIIAPTIGFASLLGVVFGGFSTALVHYWLMFYGDYSIWTIGGVVLGYIGYHSLLAPILRGLARIKPSYRFLVLAAAWALYEYLKSSGFLGFPWGLISHAFTNVTPLIQFADLTGVWGPSLLAALFNTMAAEGLVYFLSRHQNRKKLLRNQFGFVTLLTLMALAYGIYILLGPTPGTNNLRVLLVQHNENPWSTGGADDAITRAQDLTLAGSKELLPDLVVWSETAIRYYFKEEQFERALRRVPRRRPIFDFINDMGVPFLVGAPFKPSATNEYQNSALLIAPDGKLVEHYAKQHLVPFAETVPFWELKIVESFFNDVLGLTKGWGRGTSNTLFSLNVLSGESFTFATPICFEDAYPDLCRRFVKLGADLLINLTNVSWSKRMSAEYQMLAAARFRSIENRRVLVRATNGGVTSIIGVNGEILESIDLFVADVLVSDVAIQPLAPLTIYTRFGDYLPLVIGVLLVVFLAVNRVANRARVRDNHFASNSAV